ncbi:hypothetical protein ACFSVJ_17585 [Prauserella oleivorans]
MASLTLVAPAGFGDRINADYLRGFAAATSRRELKPHLTALFADPEQVTRKLADDLMKFKRLDGVDAALDTLLGTLLDGDAPALDVAPLLSRIDVPVAVVWGRQDAVLPVENASGLDGVVHVDAAGHMVHMEQPGRWCPPSGPLSSEGFSRTARLATLVGCARSTSKQRCRRGRTSGGTPACWRRSTRRRWPGGGHPPRRVP